LDSLALSVPFLLAGMLLAGPAQAATTTPWPPVADSPNVVDWLSVGALWVTSAGVLVAIWQIFISRTTAKIERTRSFQERYQADGFRQSVSLMVRTTEAQTTDACVEFIKAWSNCPDATSAVLPSPKGGAMASVQDIERTLNLFEEMGTARKLKQLHEKTIEKSLAPNIIQIFTTSWWMICWLREGHLADEDNQLGEVYVEFEAMCRGIRYDLPEMMTDMHFEPAPNIRALCLPHGCERDPIRDDAVWSSSKRMSRSLSAFVKKNDRSRSCGSRLATLAAGVEAVHSPPIPTNGPATEKWDVILVPATIDQPYDDEWKTQHSAALRIAQALDRCDEQGVLDIAVDHLETVGRT
jgi:hypothetical protein